MRFIVQPGRAFPSDAGPRAALLVPHGWDDRRRQALLPQQKLDLIREIANS
ncbi:hypothetical protein [Streptomyces sp. RerS4]|uniref:hypothetical protein n=1 Tax=Streptomyces sp. RerS4 TaxID=2942449 RepID=UPI00201C11B5|nr:hypothetical protein [Streptomyces sp. RerS4]UQW99187.1 hypothetical protein M4D82_00505 [Streptomyces sp. RerS4]